jgi:ribosomal protein L30E
MQIVLARLDDGAEVVKAGRMDLGEQHTFRAIKVPTACMWTNNGTDADRQKAEKFAKTEGYTVLCYDGESDPLNRARRDIGRLST